MKNDERVGEIIKKVFDTLFTEEPTIEEALEVWGVLGGFIFSENYKLSETETMMRMLMCVREQYKNAINKAGLN